MNWDMLKSHWDRLRGEARKKWAWLTDTHRKVAGRRKGLLRRLNAQWVSARPMRWRRGTIPERQR